jgi:hypothetical protein
MSNLSFDIKTTSDFLKKLLEDYKEFCRDKTSSRAALNCAITAWHLTEWTYIEFQHQIANQFTTLGLYQKYLKAQCPSLQIMHDLTTGTKHFLLKSHSPVIKDTTLVKGSFSIDFDRDFDISTLNIELNDGTKSNFEDEIGIAVNFWMKYLQSNFNIIN